MAARSMPLPTAWNRAPAPPTARPASEMETSEPDWASLARPRDPTRPVISTAGGIASLIPAMTTCSAAPVPLVITWAAVPERASRFACWAPFGWKR